ncbi:MAG TPA: universal stress protein [Anaerolineae bacterium]|nr:universal stress protein [Anaerolineae bacterium]
MGKILCATRGGEASYRTQDKVITLAKESGDELLFLFVMDLHFLDRTAAPIVVDVTNNIADMGEFLLLMAKERAAKQGVEARTLIREGEVIEELEKAAQEEAVSLIVLGSPVGEESLFELVELERLAERIQANAGIRVQIL